MLHSDSDAGDYDMQLASMAKLSPHRPKLLGKIRIGSSSCKSMPTLSAVYTIKQRKTSSESTVTVSTSPGGTAPFTTCAYSADASARKVIGNE